MADNTQAERKKLWSYFNAGLIKTNIKDGIGKIIVLFNASGITNIISFDKVEQVYTIKYFHINQVFFCTLRA